MGDGLFWEVFHHHSYCVICIRWHSPDSAHYLFSTIHSDDPTVQFLFLQTFIPTYRFCISDLRGVLPPPPGILFILMGLHSLLLILHLFCSDRGGFFSLGDTVDILPADHFWNARTGIHNVLHLFIVLGGHSYRPEPTVCSFYRPDSDCSTLPDTGDRFLPEHYYRYDSPPTFTTITISVEHSRSSTFCSVTTPFRSRCTTVHILPPEFSFVRCLFCFLPSTDTLPFDALPPVPPFYNTLHWMPTIILRLPIDSGICWVVLPLPSFLPHFCLFTVDHFCCSHHSSATVWRYRVVMLISLRSTFATFLLRPATIPLLPLPTIHSILILFPITSLFIDPFWKIPFWFDCSARLPFMHSLTPSYCSVSCDTFTIHSITPPPTISLHSCIDLQSFYRPHSFLLLEHGTPFCVRNVF